MTLNGKKIELNVFEAASVYCYGSDIAVSECVLDEDEFFILRLNYAGVDYLLRTNGTLDLSGDVAKLSMRVVFPDGRRVERAFVDALTALCASAYLRDRHDTVVELSIELILSDSSQMYKTAYDINLAHKSLERIMRKLHRRLFAEAELASVTLPTLNDLKFPYKSIRNGQGEFIKAAYSAIKKGSLLFVEAPTGIGKTMSAIYPSLRGLGRGYCDKIFYLTAKGSVSVEAYKACERLFATGARLRCIRIEAKGKMCPMRCGDDFECEPYRCPLMKGYSERSEDALYDVVNSRYGFVPEFISEVAARYNVCPYELSLDVSELCQMVICDYNYAFDPKVRIKRYFDEQAENKKYVFLIDEAHNLASRAKEMYSSSVSYGDVRSLYREISLCEKEYGSSDTVKALKDAVNVFGKRLRSISSLCNESKFADRDGIKHGFYLSSTPVDRLSKAADELEKALIEFKRGNRSSPIYSAVNTFLSDLSYFAEQMRTPADGMRYYISLDGDEITAKCMCVDPSVAIAERLEFASSAIFFSATLSPTEYYVKMLSNGKKSTLLTLNSPFDRNNLFCAAYTNISTRYEDREKNAKRIVSVISGVLRAKKGNYMIYFPSYGYMNLVYDKFVQKYPRVHTMVQRNNMSFKERQSFIDFFSDDTSAMRVGFCVLGGLFSEGIDLPGNRLIGTIIVGVGLPGISSEQNIVKEYYDFCGENGFDFAYTFPGMNNVLQAAGRVIRSENDRGVVVFVDDRYSTEKYRRLLPERFRGMDLYDDVADLSDDIDAFWEKN